MKALTEQQKIDKKARDALANLSNKCKLMFSMGKLKTHRELLAFFGIDTTNYYPFELDRVLTFEDVKNFLSDRYIELTTEQWLRENPPELNHENLENNNTRTDNTRIEVGNLVSNIEGDRLRDRKEQESSILIKVSEDKGSKENDYGLVSSPNEKVYHYWFQKKGAAQAIDGITKKHYRNQLVVAGTGTGKTFIAGAIFRRLWDMQFHKGKTVSPWPYLYITKSSVVEQTVRVFKNFYNLGHREVFVTNIEQLRSTAGSLWINEKEVVKQGEVFLEYEWRDLLHPFVVMLDECQQAKNSWSVQSQIIQAFAKIRKEVYMIWLSATPGTKVSEFKAFVLNCHLQYEMSNPLKVTPMEMDVFEVGHVD